MVVMLIEWVVTSAFLILVVLALRAALGKRVSARLRYALWAVVLVRLLVPVQLFTSPIAGTFVLLGSDSDQGIYTVPDPPTLPDAPDNVLSLGGQDGPSVALTNFPQAPNPPTLPDTPEPPAAPDLTKAPVWLGWTWLAGSAAVALVLLVSNLRFYWKLRRERIPLEGTDCPLRVYAAVGLPSPCLFGIFRPAIYVTPEAAADPDMLRHVIAHEYTHYRQGDHLWSLLRCGALAAHWWNPLVWLAAVFSQRDAELACDEGALKRLGDGERAGYGKTLLALVTAKPRPADLLRCATTMAGDKKSLKERISRIAKAPKRVIWAVVVAVLVTALACVCAFGQAAETEDKPSPDPTPEPSSVQAVPAHNETGAIPAQVQRDAEELVQEWFESFRDNGVLRTADGTAAVVPDPPEVDAWRIDDLWGPFWSGEMCQEVLGIGRPIELWRVMYSYHTTTPEKVTHLGDADTNLGNIEVAEDGWINYINCSADYLVYGFDEDGNRTLITYFDEAYEEVWSVKFRSDLRTKLAAGGVPEDEIYAYTRVEHAEFPPLEQLPNYQHRAQTDLNHNGVSEFIQLVTCDEEMSQRLEIWETGAAGTERLIWYGEGFHAHAGWIGYFLYNLDGKEYLLRYTPTMYHGICNYSYQLFTLENGVETVVKENSIEFEVDVDSPFYTGNFYPEIIADFMDEINGLLAHSVQLLNTDEDLAPTFEKEGRLYDSLGWLDWDWGTFVRDDGKSLLENLRDFKEAMEGEWYAGDPEVTDIQEAGSNHLRLVRMRYQDRTVEFFANWDSYYQPSNEVKRQVLDLNSDGRDEIVCIFTYGHGTGVLLQEPHIFDAQTLEEYNLSGLRGGILEQIKSTGDEENFYLSAPGLRLDETISRQEVREGCREEIDPMADTLNLGDWIGYTIEDGQMFCWLGCDATGVALYYPGYVKIQLSFTGSGFQYGTARYTTDRPFQ